MLKYRVTQKIAGQKSKQYEGYLLTNKIPKQGKKFKLNKVIYTALDVGYTVEKEKVVVLILAEQVEKKVVDKNQ